jgi:DNA-directed RNA polymerase specialized sigma24 family protein
MLAQSDYPDTTLHPERFTRSGAATADAEFDQLLSAARPRLHRIARSQGLAHEAADDIAQETLVEAWRHLEQLRDPTRFDAWLIDGISTCL